MKRILFFGLLAVIFHSCALNNSVVSGNGIQKRKYRKGFYVEKNAHIKGNETVNNDHVDQDLKPEFSTKEFVDNNSSVVSENTNLKKETQSNKVQEKLTSESTDKQIQSTASKGSMTNIDETDQSVEESVFSSENKRKVGNAVKHKVKKDLKKWNRRGGSDTMVIVGIILCVIGLSPFGVLLGIGTGTEFTINIILWGVGIVCIILSVFLALSVNFLGLLLVVLGGLLLLAAFIHGLVVLIKAL